VLDEYDAVCGRVFLGGSLAEKCVIMEDGHVVGVSPSPGLGARVYNAAGSLVLPGLLDIHVHLRGLRLSYKEDERTGTLAALSAGITLVVDMPNTEPPLRTPSSIEEKLSALRSRSATDYAVYAGIPGDEAVLREVEELPIAGFKMYPEDIESRMWVASRMKPGTLLVLHPELPEALKPVADDERQRAVMRGGHLEAAAVDLVAGLLGGRLRVHVTHASTPSTLRAARRNGFTVDTTVNYIMELNCLEECMCKVNPPRRDPWRMMLALLRGDVDCLVSDHAPHSWMEKREDYLICPAGIPGLEHWPWMLFSLVVHGALSLEDFVSLTSTRPARILGLGGVYGSLEPGFRANIVVVDAGEAWRVTLNEYSKARHTPYWMAERHGVVEAVFIGGCMAYNGCAAERSAYNPINPFETVGGGGVRGSRV